MDRQEQAGKGEEEVSLPVLSYAAARTQLPKRERMWARVVSRLAAACGVPFWSFFTWIVIFRPPSGRLPTGRSIGTPIHGGSAGFRR